MRLCGKMFVPIKRNSVAKRHTAKIRPNVSERKKAQNSVPVLRRSLWFSSKKPEVSGNNHGNEIDEIEDNFAYQQQLKNTGNQMSSLYTRNAAEQPTRDGNDSENEVEQPAQSQV